MATQLLACVSGRGPLPTGGALTRELRRAPTHSHVEAATAPAAARLPSVVIDPRDGLAPDEAALIAVAVNPALAAIRDQHAIGRATVVTAGILPNPQVVGSVSVPTDGPTANTVVGYGVNLSWNLTPILSRGAAVEAAQLGLESIDLNIAWQEWQVAQSARLAAGRLVFLDRRAAIAERSVTAFQARVATVQQALDEGNATILTVSAAQSALQSATLSHLRIVQARRIARLDLLNALGVPPTTELDVDSNATLPSWEHVDSLESIMESLPDQRLDLRALRRGYESQSVQIRTQVLRAFPQLVVQVGRASDTSALGTVGVSVSLGLPFFNRNQGAVQTAEATQAQLYDQYLSRVQSARNAVAQALANMRSVREQIAVAQEAVRILGNLVPLAEQQAGQGNVSLIDLYDLRVRYLTTQLTLQVLLQSQFELGVALDVAAGRILADTQRGSG